MKKNKNEIGFGLIESLLLIIAVALVVFVGYYVYHTQKQTDKTLNQAAATSQKSPDLTNKTTAKASTAAHTPAEAVSFVQKTYDAYKQASMNASGEPTGTTVSLDAIKADLTSSFYNKVKTEYSLHTVDSDQISCIQNTLIKPVASLKSSNTSTASIQIVDNGYQTPTTLGTATVDLTSLLISNVACPGA